MPKKTPALCLDWTFGRSPWSCELGVPAFPGISKSKWEQQNSGDLGSCPISSCSTYVLESSCQRLGWQMGTVCVYIHMYTHVYTCIHMFHHVPSCFHPTPPASFPNKAAMTQVFETLYDMSWLMIICDVQYIAMWYHLQHIEVNHPAVHRWMPLRWANANLEFWATGMIGCLWKQTICVYTYMYIQLYIYIWSVYILYNLIGYVLIWSTKRKRVRLNSPDIEIDHRQGISLHSMWMNLDITSGILRDKCWSYWWITIARYWIIILSVTILLFGGGCHMLS